MHTILYIEDHALNIQLVKKMLKFLPYQVLDAMTAKSGLVMAQLHKPDLILMDVNLPDMDGLELTTLIKTYDSLRLIPVLVLTADSSHAVYERCLAVGCDGYLNKPISKAQLLKPLQQLLPPPLKEAY